MKFVMNYLFGGHLNTLPFEPENAKEPSKVMIKVIDGVSRVVGKKFPKLGDIIYMEEGFLLMNGALTKKANKDLKSCKYENMTIVNNNGHKLVGRFYKCEKKSNKYALLIHGYRMTGMSEWLRYIPYYLSLNVNVIVVDMVGAGESEGDYVTFGIQESKDILLWIEYINKRFDNPNMFMHGDSMGASSVLLATGKKELPSNVKFAISDAGFSSVYDEFSYVLSSLHLPAKLLYFIVKVEFLIKSGYNLDKANAVKAASKSKTPTLFIHGKRDVFVPFEQGLKAYEACGAKDKELCEFETASHCQSMFKDPDRYFEIIGKWINKYLK